MKRQNKKHFGYIINLLIPAVLFGSVTGILTSIIILIYKVFASHIIEFSEHGYEYLHSHTYIVPVVLILLFPVALLLSRIYKKTPHLSGGGIPMSIGALRGIIKVRWALNLVGVFLLSLLSFFIGVPLGTEGPSVQMGTAAGMGSIDVFSKKHKAWERYSMTGGACAGFSVATGAPISGILFSIEEAHQRISPMILIVSATSVMFSYITTEILAPLLGVGTTLFSKMTLPKLSASDSWIPLLIGIIMGAFAVLFLNYYNSINYFFNKKLKKIPHSVKIFFIFFSTVLLGISSFDFISTGHELIISLFEKRLPLLFLLLILLVRSSLTLGANTNGITGGVFIPILAIGAVFSAVLAFGIENIFGVSGEYYEIILVLGITACISGMMKMPLTAIAFSVEALFGFENIIYIIIASVAAFIMTEVFDAKSITDRVLDNKIEEQNHGVKLKVIDTHVVVKENSFAVGKQIRDIFWPANLFVLSVKNKEAENAEIDEHGGKALRANDTLHVRYCTANEASTKDELIAIVGEQEYSETETKTI